MDRIEGQVFMHSQLELPGAQVEIILPGAIGGHDVFVFSGQSDHHGKFSGESSVSIAGTNLIEVRVSRLSHSETLTFRLGQFSVTSRRFGGINTSGSDDVTLTLNFHVSWSMNLSLPLNEYRRPLQDIRAAGIAQHSLMYPWSSRLGIPLVSGDQLPPPEIPTIAFLAGNPLNPGFFANAARNISNTQTIANRRPEERLESFDAFRDQYDDGGPNTPPMRRPAIIANDYPPTTDGFPSDASFAWQRLAGVNPVVLRLLTDFPKDDFPLEQVDLRPYFQDFAALDHARRERQLYIADYEFLAGVKQNDERRYLPAPFALFYFMGERKKDDKPPTPIGDNFSGERPPRRDGWTILPGAGDFKLGTDTPLSGGLAPVAIQIDRNFDSVKNPIFTPKDVNEKGNSWGVAKLRVQIADLNYHETKTHLAEAHLLMEGFKVGMERTLAANHPLYVLLRYHFEGLMAINYLAFRTLIAPGGGVDKLLGNTLEGSFRLTERAAERWDFQKLAFKADIEARGLLDADTTIPSYPYRDDGLRVWNAIHSFVEDYLFIYYVNNEAVTEDSELLAWLKEMNEKGVHGVPSVQTRSDLTEFVTNLIFNCSARHASINYSQYDYVGFIPNMPGASFGKPIKDDGTVMTNLLALLPPAKETRDMVELMANLSPQSPFGTLGMYTNGLEDPDADNAAKRFRDKLREIDSEIERENRNRLQDYIYLMPRTIPNSTNV